MREIYGEGRRGGVWAGFFFPRKKCKLHTEKIKIGAHFCVILLFRHEIIVDSKLPGDLVQAPRAGRLTPVSGRLPGVPRDLGPPLNESLQSQPQSASWY